MTKPNKSENKPKSTLKRFLAAVASAAVLSVAGSAALPSEAEAQPVCVWKYVYVCGPYGCFYQYQYVCI